MAEGMTLLDYFAGQALAGLMTRAGTPGMTPEHFAQDAYTSAVAMLKERHERMNQNAK